MKQQLDEHELTDRDWAGQGKSDTQEKHYDIGHHQRHILGVRSNVDGSRDRWP
jgi:hypothetical protein